MPMTRPMFAYTKIVLESVSFDHKLFLKELQKAMKILLPYELEQLREWLQGFTEQNPELKYCLKIVNA
jgi:DNA replication protein DnaD